jgi:hypothetical protein
VHNHTRAVVSKLRLGTTAADTRCSSTSSNSPKSRDSVSTASYSLLAGMAPGTSSNPAAPPNPRGWAQQTIGQRLSNPLSAAAAGLNRLRIDWHPHRTCVSKLLVATSAPRRADSALSCTVHGVAITGIVPTPRAKVFPALVFGGRCALRGDAVGDSVMSGVCRHRRRHRGEGVGCPGGLRRRAEWGSGTVSAVSGACSTAPLAISGA